MTPTNPQDTPAEETAKLAKELRQAADCYTPRHPDLLRAAADALEEQERQLAVARKLASEADFLLKLTAKDVNEGVDPGRLWEAEDNLRDAVKAFREAIAAGLGATENTPSE